MKNSTFLRTVTLIYQSSPKRFLAMLSLIIIGGILPAFSVLVTIELINEIVQAVYTGGDFTMNHLIFVIALWGVITLVSNVSALLLNSLQVVIIECFSVTLMDRLSQKVMNLSDLSFYENRDNLVKLGLVRDGLHVRPLNFIYNVSGNLQRVISLLSMFIVLFYINIYLPFLMFFSTVPVLLLSNYAGKKQWKATEFLQNEKENLFTYVKHGIDGDKAKDNILFGFMRNFYGYYQRISGHYLGEFVKISQKSFLFSLLVQIISTFITIALFVMMISIVLTQKIAAGAIAGYIQAFMRVQLELQDLASLGRWFFILNGYFENYFSLIDWQSEKTTQQKMLLDEPITHIALKNVSFAYPTNSEKMVLENINFEIDNNKRYSIVGKNGSGKTTLIKLLGAFYKPTSGEIIINKKYDLNDLDLFSYRDKLSAVFQDFTLYNGFSLDENIFVQEFAENDEKRSALMKSFDERFQQRMQDGTKIVGTQFGGEDFSGGEKQKLAALRAFLKSSDMLFFDEPTSAIDPISEKEFINTIFTMSEGKIALVVTHRMGSVQNSDQIIVIDQGKLCEQGTFDELLDQKGLFEELYQTQKSQFL